MINANAMHEEPIRLPTVRLAATAVIVPALACAGWMVAGSDPVAGIAGAGIVAIVNVLGVLVLSPWRQRAIADWMTMWLGITVLRLLVTPVMTFLLYSATSLAPEALGFAVGLSYVPTIFAEAAILAAYLNRRVATGRPGEVNRIGDAP